ncbi:MAG: glycosyltransferase family 4 protein [Acidobacteriota bacterium]
MKEAIFSNVKSNVRRGAPVRLLPVKLLIAAPSLDILGGQPRQAAVLLDWFSREPELEVSFVPHNPRLPGALRWLQKIKYVRTVVTSLWYWALLLIRVRRCDVLHAFSASYYSYLLSVMPALLVAKLYGKKSVLNYRSGEAEDHLENWPLTAKPTMKWADVIAVQSGYLKDVFARFGLKATIVPSSINLERFHFRERKPLQPVFLSNRLHEPLYNVACILRAFALIQRRYPNARLIVAGDGTQRTELEYVAFQLGLNQVEFVGRVEYDDMPTLYDRADIYLNAPNLDNLPSSILESYAAGLPVVTSDAGGIPHILWHEETGLLVGLDDHVGMATSAMRLLEDQSLAERLTKRGLQECEKYSAEQERHSWISLYQKLVSADLPPQGATEGATDAPTALTAAKR